MSRPEIKVFISYAHKDSNFFEVFKNGLNSHLYTSNKFDFGVWEDSKIHLGSFWDNEIQESLAQGGIAILCVTANFLNSRYIEANEFKTLITKFPNTLIVPVYFNHCNINAWDELSQRQFFKPSGNRYNRATAIDFTFCDLVKFRQTDGSLIDDSNIDLYFKDLVANIEEALTARYATNKDSQEPNKEVLIPAHKEIIIKTPTILEFSVDKIVTIVIILFMIMSMLLICFNLFSSDWNTAVMFKSSLGCVMFFGSFAAFMFNAKSKKSIV